jgi:pyroglutamyl-peptidase
MSSASNTIDDDNSDRTQKDFLFVVTGFGPFNGVPENPTSIIIKALPAYLQQRVQRVQQSDDDDNNKDCKEDVRLLSFLASRLDTILVETSAEAAAKEVQDLQTKLSKYEAAVVLHLGVHDGSNNFRLEQCAYNDATFRVPDERGFQPTKQTVLSAALYDWGHAFTTSFDVPALVKQLNETCPMSSKVQTPEVLESMTPMANVSQDPGRFVCNYIYCSSLQAFDNATTKDDKHPYIQSLFLHVPPFRIVPQNDQLEFVTQTMLALYRENEKLRSRQ